MVSVEEKGVGRNRTEGDSFVFGQFLFDPFRRVLWRGGKPVPLSPRLMNALQVFVERPGELLHKNMLVNILWPDTVVEENSLSKSISALRSALGDDGSRFIRTESRQGFRFVCPVSRRRLPGSQAEAREESESHGAPSGPTLAVLPFVNLEDDPAQDYFVAGMMEEVVAALTRIRSLFVIASSSSLALKGDELRPEQAARHFGVRYVLEGTVRRADSRVRITVKLTDVSSNTQIWSERFEHPFEDIFALQDQVALQVAGIIEPSIGEAELRRAVRSPVENPGCYDLCLRASRLRLSLHRVEVIQALGLLEQALQLDPEFAQALAQAAGCHSQICLHRWSEDLEHHRSQGYARAERALAACGDDAAVLAQVANALMDLEQEAGSNIDRAVELIDRAITLNPGSAFAWFISGVLNLVCGDGVRAMDHLQRAMKLAPLSPIHELARKHLGLGLVVQGKYLDAWGMLHAAGSLTARGQLALACVSSELGELGRAREELAEFERMSTTPAESMLRRMARHEAKRKVYLGALERIRASH